MVKLECSEDCEDFSLLNYNEDEWIVIYSEGDDFGNNSDL